MIRMMANRKNVLMKSGTILFIALCLLLSDCNKKEQPSVAQDTNILSYSIQNSPAQVSIVSSQHEINIRFPDSVMNGEGLIANFTLSPGCKATIKNIEQVSGVSKNNYANVFVYTVSSPGNSSDWRVTSTNNDYTTSLGLGNFIQQTARNDCSYPWYLDQGYTGPYTYSNCGPTCVTMACKWADSAFTKTPEDARSAYRPEGGDWYADDITFYLRDNNIPNSTLALPATAEGTMETFKRQVDLHQILILLLDMNLVRYQSDSRSHADKFYYTDSTDGHFVIIKGYKEVDNEMYFEVYDPGSMGRAYDNWELKGKDRYYRSEDLFEATKAWWPKVFIIAKKGTAVIE
jgi:hypothetical protein